MLEIAPGTLAAFGEAEEATNAREFSRWWNSSGLFAVEADDLLRRRYANSLDTALKLELASDDHDGRFVLATLLAFSSHLDTRNTLIGFDIVFSERDVRSRVERIVALVAALGQ